MPPEDEGGQMPADEIDILTRWVAMGAPDPRSGDDAIGGMTGDEARAWWAFQPLPAGPPLTSRDIDALLEREWAARSLVPAPPADRQTLIRRAAYDLTGLPPTPEQTREFLADESPAAFAHLIEQQLASPQYGVRWGRHWLDVVRYADTAGENTDRPLPQAWRYRNWVFDLPPLNGTTSRAIIWWCQNQRRAFHATRKERTGRADHPQAARGRSRGGAR